MPANTGHSGLSSDQSSEPLPVGVGLKDWVPNDETEAFTKVTSLQLELPIENGIDPLFDLTAAWHTAMQQIPVLQLNQLHFQRTDLLAGSSPISGGGLAAASFPVPLITFSPEQVKRRPVRLSDRAC